MAKENIIDLPLQTRADVRLQAETIDAEARTVEVVWSTGPRFGGAICGPASATTRCCRSIPGTSISRGSTTGRRC
jgi:hypothetical protein